jgi:TetR/AcrR family transcriptional repressor of nem operon
MIVMARYDQQHKGRTRTRILAESERLMKRNGAGSATVDAVMRAAGLTVGGFYAHFESKEALAQQSLLFGIDQSFRRLTEGLESHDDRAFLRAMITRYFAQLDCESLDDACPMTLALADVARSDEHFRGEFAERAASHVRTVQHRFPGIAGMSPAEVALAVFAALAGAVALARAVARPHVRPRIVAATERMLYAMLELGTTPAARDAN